MKVTVRIASLLSSLLVGSACYTYVYQVQHLYNANLPQHIILLSDYHEDNSKSTAQRLAILDTAKKHGAYLLSEDQAFLYQDISEQEVIAYVPCLQPIINDLIADPINFDARKNYHQNYSDLDPASEGNSTPLFLITPMARQRGIKAATVEARQAEIISSKGGPISAADACKAYDKIIHDIERYDDDEIYNAFYKKSVATYNEHLALAPTLFAYLRSSQETLKQAYTDTSFEPEAQACYRHIKIQDMLDYYQEQGLTLDEAKQHCNTATSTEEDDIYEKLICALYLFVVDTNIIHEIALHEQLPVIIIYAGGTHIESVIPVLKAHGYELVRSHGSLQDKPVNLDLYFSKLATHLPVSSSSSSEYLQNSWLTMLEEPYVTGTLESLTGSTYSASIDQHICKYELEKFLA